MNWAEACAALLEGKKVRRAGWHEMIWWQLSDVYGRSFPLVLVEHFQCQSASARITALELEATDWEIVEVPA